MQRSMVAAIAVILMMTPAWAEWNYYNIPDEMRGTATLHALTKSTNRVEIRFPYHGGSHAYLVLQKMPPRTKYTVTDMVLIYVKPGQIRFDLKGVHIAVKFDDGPVESIIGIRPRDHGQFDVLALTHETYDKFVKRLLRAKTLKVEIPLYGDGDKVFTFDVSGLDAKWPEIAKDTAAKR